MIRRIVTGHRDGKSVVVSDEPLTTTREYTAMKGLRTTMAWTSPGVPTLPYDGADPTASVTSIIPGPGGTTLLIVNFPPDAVMLAPDYDEAVATAEYAAHLPGLAELFEVDNPGMHTTHTLDYDILLDGEIWLELDDGAEVKVEAHDIVVQNGVRHAWRNKSDRPATMAFILFGAQR